MDGESELGEKTGVCGRRQTNYTWLQNSDFIGDAERSIANGTNTN